MVEELKQERHKLENLIGCKDEVNITSCEFTQKLIEALDAKYKSDQASCFRLHELELLYELVQKAQSEGKSQLLEKHDEFRVKPNEIDDWNDMLSLSNIYFVLEHPSAHSFNRKRRITKKTTIDKYTPEDFVEWRVAQQFRLRGLEEWTKNQINARKLSKKSKYNFDDLSHGREWRELQDLHEICDPPVRKAVQLTAKQKETTKKRPFKLTGDCMEDWTESYSEESSESDEEDVEFQAKTAALEKKEKREEKFALVADLLETSSSDDDVSEELFKGRRFFLKYKDSVFQEMDQEPTIENWLKKFEEATSKYAQSTSTTPVSTGSEEMAESSECEIPTKRRNETDFNEEDETEEGSSEGFVSPEAKSKLNLTDQDTAGAQDGLSGPSQGREEQGGSGITFEAEVKSSDAYSDSTRSEVADGAGRQSPDETTGQSESTGGGSSQDPTGATGQDTQRSDPKLGQDKDKTTDNPDDGATADTENPGEPGDEENERPKDTIDPVLYYE